MPDGAGQVRRALAVEVRVDDHRAGRRDVVAVEPEPGGGAVDGERAVERAGERQEAARGVGEAGDDPGRVGGRPLGDREDRARRPEAHRRLADAEPEAERRAHVVAGAGADDRAARQAELVSDGGGHLAGELARAEQARQEVGAQRHRRVVEDLRLVGAGRGRPPARAGGVAAVRGGRAGQAAGDVVVRQLDGRAPRPRSPARCGAARPTSRP